MKVTGTGAGARQCRHCHLKMEVSCHTPHACYMPHATCDMRHATCDMPRATCHMPHAHVHAHAKCTAIARARAQLLPMRMASQTEQF
eukprot:3602909-Prymnesium_polylepis.1